jgi:flavoprotein
MIEEVTRHCPNCKTEITVIPEGGPQGENAIKKCPGCDSPILFCPDGYIVQAVTAFTSRKQD